MKYLRLALCMSAAFLAFGTMARADGQAPVRHLVYHFSVSLDTTLTQQTSGIGGDGPASGSVDSRAANSDDGTITADVLAVQPDTGLVVRITETGRGTRNSAPVMCVTYGTTGVVICDMTAGGATEEETSLLRVLGKDFFNRAMLDAKNHWRTSADTPQGKETNDYNVGSMDDATAIGINFQRVLSVSGSQAFDATTDGKIVYNEKLSVPNSLVEETVTRRNSGMSAYTRVDQKMSFKLQADSLAQAGH